MAAADALYEIMSIMVKRGPLSLSEESAEELWCRAGEGGHKKESPATRSQDVTSHEAGSTGT